MEKRDDNHSEQNKKLVDVGTEVAGGLAGAGIGLVVAGPVGALIGGAAAPVVTHTIRKLVEDFRSRTLSRREVFRVDTVLAIAATKIEEKRNSGLEVRQDGFFTEEIDERSAGEEIMEGVLLIAQREYEERKLRFYGNLLANIAFRVDISRTVANQFIRISERTSYYQLLILAFVRRYSVTGEAGEFRYNFELENTDLSSINVFENIFDLLNQGILDRTISYDLHLNATIPQLKVSRVGLTIYELMELNEISEDDILEISKYIDLTSHSQYK